MLMAIDFSILPLPVVAFIALLLPQLSIVLRDGAICFPAITTLPCGHSSNADEVFWGDTLLGCSPGLLSPLLSEGLARLLPPGNRGTGSGVGNWRFDLARAAWQLDQVSVVDGHREP